MSELERGKAVPGSVERRPTMTEADEVIGAPRRVDSPVPGRVSSPASTGGVGTFFEQHVVVHWLAQLLVRAIPPILLDCTIEEVDVQTEGLGWRTDDFLIVGVTASGEHRALAVSMATRN
jgi:hypothetical protein